MKFTVKKEDCKVFVSFPYKAEVVQFIKTLEKHKWNPTDKSWEISDKDLKALKEAFKDDEFVDYKELKPNTTLSNDFCMSLRDGIERILSQSKIVPSKTLKPSGLHCNRGCYYVLQGKMPDRTEVKYSWSGCAATGTDRHTYIQDYLIKLSEDPKFDFIYIDVGEYVEMKHKEGKCLDIRVGSRKGAETHLYNDKLKLSFFCDGIIKRKSTGEYYLFEFKNKTSNKYAGCDLLFPDEHYDQCVCYCMCLDLEKVFLLVENRDNCELTCPPEFIVTQEMKTEMENKLVYIIDCSDKKILPPKPSDLSGCRFCPYKKYCDKEEV